ncbi:PPOX class F420-dependent oxidoreductase [Pseudactinotalea sp. HY158]|uniref:PPOX class F420-dependent oxidoreductase n=1 Tax=Pseudactinotalea sp. HY158 TaxID=2654547 RepID=UPI00129CDAD0|nr:PPOX class F420-dependent oxidoreductase [Pseudactinotalea sp. HY158]QGH70396.1 TIGR03618 family F420-dependent PPOX class oxidoreductase [Pseudactinotalea sp. HY158]
METIPGGLRDLVTAAHVGCLGTVRPDGGVQVNPMWFRLNEGAIEFTHTTTRAKFRNLQENPAMSLCVTDPADPDRFIELRGRLIRIEPDPTGRFYQVLAARYGQPDAPAPPDAENRVILVMSIEHVTRK